MMSNRVQSGHQLDSTSIIWSIVFDFDELASTPESKLDFKECNFGFFFAKCSTILLKIADQSEAKKLFSIFSC